MAKLTILRGISGSGKSTWARNQNAVVISRDAIPHGLLEVTPEDWYSGAKSVAVDENVVTKIQDAAIEACLKAGKDVIVDNTNIQFKYVRALAKIGYRQGADVEVKVFDVPLDEAIKRVNGRANRGGRFVAHDIVRDQHNRFKSSKSMTLDPVQMPEPYTGTPGKPKAFLVDVDGTLAHMNGKRGPFEWHNVLLDDADETIIDIVNRLGDGGSLNHDDLTVIVMSGRDKVCEADTADWLDACGIRWHHLYMRPEGDMRPDNLIKAELFDEHIRDNFDVKFVLDDRQQVVDMWRRMGLTCLQVAPGEF